MMLGICCTCQSRHPVKRDLKYISSERDETEDGPSFDVVPSYLMKSHYAFGRYCEGSGTTPQAILDTSEQAAPK